jgi:hypothetical protein
LIKPLLLMSEEHKLQHLLEKYNENNYTEEEECELCEILLLDIWNIENNIKDLIPLLKKFIKKILNSCNSYEEFVDSGHDLFFVTINPELLKYTLSFADKLNVIKCMIEYADGPENMESIVELMYNHRLKLPREIVDSTFTDEELNWCGWGDRAEELRNMFTRCD